MILSQHQVKKGVMTKAVSERDLLENGYREHRYRRDRNDVYVYLAEYRNFDTHGVYFQFVCEEVNCNPDFDW